MLRRSLTAFASRPVPALGSRASFLFAVVIALAVSSLTESRADSASPIVTTLGESIWIRTADKTADADPLFELDLAALKAAVSNARDEWNPIDTRPAVMITMPMPDGSTRRFEIVESSIMEPELAAQFPQIKTYGGRGIDDPSDVIRFDISPRGLHAIVLSTIGSVYIEPAGAGASARYISSFEQLEARGHGSSCLLGSADLPAIPSPASAASSTTAGAPVKTAGSLRIFRLAAAATGEFTAQNGGTVDSAMAAITTVVNGANAIYRRDLTIFFDLIAGSRQMVYTNASTDPYSGQDLVCNSTTPPCSNPPATADCLWTENQCNADAVIGNANYDLSVVFDGTNAQGGGTGRAFLNGTCDNTNKGRAATGGTFIALFAHEVGHMFTARHTFNDNANGACATLLGSNQRDPVNASEPGSGSSLMSYCGSCGAANLQPGRDQNFDGINLLSMIEFVDNGAASTCWDYAGTGNLAPVLLSMSPASTIPQSTPFELRADAYDSQGDSITYSWEQADTNGNASPPEVDDGTRPILRSYAPAAAANRYFPSLTYILNNQNVPPATYACGGSGGQCLTGEVLPSTNRTMNFNLVMRDNVDGVTVASTTVTTNTASGPFKVLSPDGGAEIWTEGAKATVTWSVANTNQPPVNCSTVNIRLSLDGGNTFPTVLAAGTPNDGQELIQIPFGPSIRARVRIEAANNIFFDISDTNFTIEQLQVTNTNDSGRGSLRQAMLDANNSLFARAIPFNIPGPGVKTINILSQLPTLYNENQSLDGWLQGGETYTGPPLIELNGAGCSDNADFTPCDGLVLANTAAVIRGFVINGFKGNGLRITGTNPITVWINHNYIGTDASGAAAVPNKLSGIRIEAGTDAWIMDNVISGNLGAGLLITGSSANGAEVLRNKIGCDVNCSVRVPNEGDGVKIVGSPGNTIGDAAGSNGNWISGNGKVINTLPYTIADGIDISGVTANGNKVLNNWIGLNLAGTGGIDNTGSGVRIENAPNTQVGGTSANARNVIGDGASVAANFGHGIEVRGAGTTGLVIQGNYLGTNAAGTAALPVRGASIFIDGAPNVQIGGTTAAMRNIIEGGRNWGGIHLTGGATGSSIQGNYIGTDVNGTVGLFNTPNYAGIYIESGTHTIGGTAPGARNVVSGHRTGIWLSGPGTSNNTIQGNYIGTDVTGNVAIANGISYAIWITGSTGTTIGGTTAAARNLISGNYSAGIWIEQSVGFHSEGTVIQGNYIGCNAAGTAALPNGAGIGLYEVSGVTIGGAAPGAGNLISSSTNVIAEGIRVYSFGHVTSGITIQGNKIGTDVTGTIGFGNPGNGIYAGINGTLQIGGSAPGAGNLISASGQAGINIAGVAPALVIQGNKIGTDITGTQPLRNNLSAIYIGTGGSHIIGGTGAGEGNVIGFNNNVNYGLNYAGINVLAGIGTSIRGNSMFGNTGLGIDIGGLGANPNDNCDADTGPNNNQNYPLISSAAVSGPVTKITGTLNSNPSSSFTLDFYSNPSCDIYGYGEGQTYLGSTTLNTNASCSGSFNITLPTPLVGVVTAVATDAAGSSSEFSACTPFTAGPVGEAKSLRWQPGTKDTLTWNAATGATSYKLIRGVTADLSKLLNSTPDGCTRYTGATTTTGPILTESPASVSGRVYWYLVVGTDGTDDGSAGDATAGPRNLTSTGNCL